MNYRFILALISLLFVFEACQEQPNVNQKVQESPSWYLEPSKNSTVIYGYATSSSLDNAKLNAREDIAKSIKVKIQSSFSLVSKSKETSLSNEVLTQDTQHSISEYTDMILTDVKLKKSVKINDKWFVKMSYTNLPIVQQIKKRFYGVELERMNKDNLLANTNFSKRLKKEFGYIPKYTIFYKNGIFFLNIKRDNFILLNAKIKQFFFVKNNKNIEFKISKKQLKIGDYFNFTINHKNDNFISLIQVDELGKIIVHFDNLQTKKLVYPNPKIYEGLQAGILNNKNEAIEMYLAVSCKEKNNFTVFDQVSFKYNSNEEAYRFPNLYNLIDKCDYSSLVTRTTR